jgi:hypothetical protein
MSGRHFEGYLPPDVELLENDTQGTTSGNPTSDVIYGFRRHVADKVDRFAVVRHLATYDRNGSERLQRRVTGVGSLLESQYADAMDDLRDPELQAEFFEASDTRNGLVVMEATIPRQRTSELIIGHVLEVIFVKV